MRFICNNCRKKIDCGPYWEGMSITCPGCNEITELTYKEGQKIQNTEYSISFTDFKQLLSYEPYSEIIHPLVKKYLRCSIERSNGCVKLVAEDNSLIPLESAHLEIQLNSGQQREIYGAAMSLWR
ncbi:MAG: hypothetical protein ACH255_20670 [Candidatus Thiodiazotropha sp.]